MQDSAFNFKGPVVAKIFKLQFLGKESELFAPEALNGINRDFNVWQMAVTVDGSAFDPIILSDNGVDVVAFYGHGLDPELVEAEMPEQARLLSYLALRTVELLNLLGPISVIFEGSEEAAERAVVQAFLAARGLALDD